MMPATREVLCPYKSKLKSLSEFLNLIVTVASLTFAVLTYQQGVSSGLDAQRGFAQLESLELRVEVIAGMLASGNASRDQIVLVLRDISERSRIFNQLIDNDRRLTNVQRIDLKRRIQELDRKLGLSAKPTIVENWPSGLYSTN
jgi:hypothetical protein